MTDQNNAAEKHDTTDFERAMDRATAEREYELYKKYGRPNPPYYGKCLKCGDMWEVGDSLESADYGARRHAGVHGGLHEEHAEIVITDCCGFEIFRVHALFKPEQQPEGCPSCGTTEEGSGIACDECGFIPEEARA